VFATSNDPDDGLVAYLLRRGVISLADREETAKRLLSNKRVGTILREIGVIDERDLREMVRRQLSEVVFDTFRWSNAEYSFVRGALPTIEDITLEESLEALVAAGLRRIDSWSRVWRGCGGLETVLELRPAYLSVLDAMQAGADEWQIVAALKEPRSARQICRTSDLGDFRVCQILWTLRVLGAVGAISAGAIADRGADAEAVSPGPTVAVADAPDESRAAETASSVEPRRFEIDRRAPVADAAQAGDDAESQAAGTEPAVEPRRFEIDRPAPKAVAGPTGEEPEPVVVATEPTITPERIEIEPPAPMAVPPDDGAADVAADAPALDATQLIPPDALASALRGAGPGAHDADESAIDATQVISPDVVDAAQADPAETIVGRIVFGPEDTGPISRLDLETPEGPSARGGAGEADPWEAPAELDDVLGRFNAAHRLVYRAVRSEVGAGATNFLRATCIQRAPEAAGLVDGVNMGADGSWDPEGLRQAPWSRYVSLLEVEIERIGEFLGTARATDLRRQIESLEDRSVAH
jgi:hypothetical protein